MELMPIIAGVLIFATVFFFVLAVAAGNASASAVMARQRLDALTRGLPEQDQGPQRAGVGTRLVGPMFGGVTKLVGSLLPKSLLAGVERKLVIAGEPMNPATNILAGL